MVINWEKRLKQTLSSAKKVGVAVTGVQDKAVSTLKKGAYWSAVFVFGLAIAGVIMHAAGLPVTQAAMAGYGASQWVAIIIGNLIYYLIIGPIGVTTVIIAWLLEAVINYPHGSFWSSWVTGGGSGNNSGGFVNVSAVVTGWKLVRDVCNIFFSLILVIIAVGTVLKIEAYHWKQLLPKFILMAVLINFSKSICGVFTDLGTVAMATFGGSFAGKFGKGLVGAFGLPAIGDLTTPNTENAASGQATGSVALFLAYIMAAVMVLILFVLLLVFLATLIFRIIMLWFLIVLSPLAYITRILPVTSKYSSQWWEMFGRYVLVGPLVTFFLWLSLSLAFGTGDPNPLLTGIGELENDTGASLQATDSLPPAVGGFQSSSPNMMANFLIATMMLMASLKVINQLAQEAGKITGAIEGAAWGAGQKILEMPGRGAMALGNYMGRAKGEGAMGSLARGAGRLAQFTGSTVLNPINFAKNAYSGITQAAQSLEAKVMDQAQRSADDMREEKVLTIEDGKKKWNPTALLSNAMGTVMGAGTQDSQYVWENVISATGVSNQLKKGLAFVQGQPEKLRELQEKNKEQQAAADDHDKKLTKEEATDFESQQSRLKEIADQMNAEINEMDVDGAIDLEDPDMQATIQARISALQDEGQYGQARDLKALLEDPSRTATRDQLEGFGMNWEDDILARKRERLGAQETKRKELEERMKASGYQIDDDGNVTAAGTDFTTVDERTKAREQATSTYNEMVNLESQLSALSSGRNHLARQSQKRRESEEAQKLADINDTDEIRDVLQRAINEKNMGLATACIRRIYENGDDNEIPGWLEPMLQQARKANPNAYLDPSDGKKLEATSDARGQELVRQMLLRDALGMSDQDSMRVMADMSYKAENGGHLGMARAYQFRAGRVTKLSEERRARIVQTEYGKRDIYALRKLNRLGFLVEDHTGRSVGVLKEGADLLKQFGTTLSNKAEFDRMTGNFKRRLSEPHVIEMLKREGVPSGVIAQLERYRRETS